MNHEKHNEKVNKYQVFKEKSSCRSLNENNSYNIHTMARGLLHEYAQE